MTIESAPLPTMNCKVVSIDGIEPLFVSMGDLRVQTWLGVVESLADDALPGTSFIDFCTSAIYPIDRKIFPCHSQPGAIVSTRNEVNVTTANTEKVDINTIADS